MDTTQHRGRLVYVRGVGVATNNGDQAFKSVGILIKLEKLYYSEQIRDK